MKQQEMPLVIGVAAMDITPPVGTTMVGYKPRVSDGLGHRLRAEALVCRPGRGRGGWALVACDAIGFPREYTVEFRRRAATVVGLAPGAILLHGTHTHSGPATTLFGGEQLSALDREYLGKTLLDKLVAVVKAAAVNARPGRFEVAWTEAPGLAANRRIEGADGKWVNEWQDPEGKHPGYFDPTVMLVGVRRPKGKLSALLVNYGVHAVVLGPGSMKLSADWPGYMKDMLEASGLVGTAIFAGAGGANINPRVCIMKGAEHPRKMGEAVAEKALAAITKLSPVAGDELAAHRQPWPIVRTRDAYKGADRPNRKQGDTVQTEIQALRAGDLGVVGLPGELFSEYNRLLRERSPLPHTLVLALANDYIGYLPTDEAQKQGAYETNMAPADPLEASLVDHAGKALDAVAAATAAATRRPDKGESRKR